MPKLNLKSNEIYQIVQVIGVWEDLEFYTHKTLKKNDLIVFYEPNKKELIALRSWMQKIQVNKLIKPDIYPVFDIKRSQKLYIIDFFSEPEKIFVPFKSK